jgi:hypothetical protein
MGKIQFGRDPGVHFRTAPLQAQTLQQFFHVFFGVGYLFRVWLRRDSYGYNLTDG